MKSLLDKFIFKAALLFLAVLLLTIYYDIYSSTFEENFASAIGLTVGISFWAYMVFLIRNKINKNDTNKPSFEDKFIKYTSIICLIWAFSEFNKYDEYNSAKDKIDYVYEDLSDTLDAYAENVLSEDIAPLKLDIVDNPRTDEEKSLNLVKEHLVKQTNDSNVYLEKVLELRTFSILNDLNTAERNLKEIKYSEIEEDFLNAQKLGYERLDSFKKDIKELADKASTGYFENTNFSEEFLNGLNSRKEKTIALQSKMLEIDIQILRLTADCVKTLKECINDWSIEETDEGLDFNFDNLNNEDFLKLSDIYNKIEANGQRQQKTLEKNISDGKDYIDSIYD